VAAEAVLYVERLSAMVDFYESCLGMQRLTAGGGYYGLRSTGWTLWLVRGRRQGDDDTASTETPVRRSEVPVKLCFAVASIDEARTAIADFGGEANRHAWDFEGSRRCDAVDPEGNVIQLLQPLGPA
jgi:catechol 2,3-dioxygenase-like lactoylglutathione lyase family enzyme